MTVKHGHSFDLDTPGTDSWRHRHEGEADRVVMASPEGLAVVGRWPEEQMPLDGIVRMYLSDAEIVLAEGYKASRHSKVEVFRSAAPGARHRSRESVGGVPPGRGDGPTRFPGVGACLRAR